MPAHPGPSAERLFARGVRRPVARAADLYWGSGVCDDVPALSWFLVESLVPLALGLTALATILLGDAAKAEALAEHAAKTLPSGVSDELVFNRADRRRLQLRDAVDESGSRRLDIALQCVDFTHVAISRDFADAAARAGAAAL